MIAIVDASVRAPDGAAAALQVSWNCCPSGYVTHSDVISGLVEGDTLVGTIQQPNSNDLVFVTTSTLVPKSGGPPKSVSLKSDMKGVSGWKPTWAEVIHEAYSVTSCAQVPCAVGTFTNLTLATTASPGGVPLSWSAPFYEIDGGTQDKAQCSGAVTPSSGGDAVTLVYDCTAPH